MTAPRGDREGWIGGWYGARRTVAIWLVLAAFAAAGASLATQAAQRSTERLVVGTDSKLVVAAQVDGLPPALLRLGAATIVLAPGQTTLPLVTAGPLLVVPQVGAVVIESDRPLAGTHQLNDGTGGPTAADLRPAQGSPGQHDLRYRLRTGQGGSIPPGTRIRIRASGRTSALVLMLSLAQMPGRGPAP